LTIVFETLGFSPDEERLYTLLLNSPRSTVADLADYAGLSPQQVARDLHRLTRRGLADRLPGKPARHVAVDPSIALEPLLTEHEEQLRRARARSHELTETFQRAARQSHPTELVEIITGEATTTNRLDRLQQAARHQIRTFDQPPYIQDMAVGNPQELQRLAAGIEYRVLYSTAAVAIPGRLDGHIRPYCKQGEQARVRPEVPLKLMIIDDRCALIPIRTGHRRVDASFVVHPCSLLDALIALFEAEWQQATPLEECLNHDPDATPGGPLDKMTLSLLACLAAGLTDDGIARAFGCSLRTAQRYTQGLMHDLGATSRFQAGMKASQRGWV
jgi:DNA-binding CsgD family transcriptional regulator